MRTGNLAVPKPTKRKRRKDAKPRCAVQRCKRRVEAVGLCATHLTQRADAAFSRFIRERDGRCVPGAYGVPIVIEVEVWVDGAPIYSSVKIETGCSGGLQCMHGVSRRYRILRWDGRNAMTGCAAHHVYFENNPLEWQAFLDKHYGAGTWARLRAEALAGGDWQETAREWAIGGKGGEKL